MSGMYYLYYQSQMRLCAVAVNKLVCDMKAFTFLFS